MGKSVVISENDARQGPPGDEMLYVLGFGTIGAIFAVAAVLAYFELFRALSRNKYQVGVRTTLLSKEETPNVSPISSCHRSLADARQHVGSRPRRTSDLIACRRCHRADLTVRGRHRVHCRGRAEVQRHRGASDRQLAPPRASGGGRRK